MKSKLALVGLVAALPSGCISQPLNENEPHFGSECYIIERSDEVMPVSFGFNHDMGESPSGSRLTIDVEVQEQDLRLGDAKLESATKYQLVIFDPFDLEGATRIAVRHTGTGDIQPVTVFEKYAADTQPAYGSVNLTLDKAEDEGRAWLHIVIGSQSEHGLKIELANA